MSTQKRKISYWSFDFLSGDEHFFDADVFCRFLAYLQTVNQQSLLYRDEKQNKAIALESIREETKQGIHMYKVVFKSCKYNHSPDYMYISNGPESFPCLYNHLSVFHIFCSATYQSYPLSLQQIIYICSFLNKIIDIFIHLEICGFHIVN